MSQTKIRNITILLTSCINPGNMPSNALTLPDKRRQQYTSAFEHIRSIVDLPIVFIDNSNTSIEDCVRIDNPLLSEFLCYQGNKAPKQFGKGAGEMEIMDFAFNHSRLIKQADFIIKLTGRLKLLNLVRYIAAIRQNPVNSVMIDFSKNLHEADARFFGFSHEFFYSYLRNATNSLDESAGIVFENVLAQSALRYISDGANYFPFPQFPRYSGVSGTTLRPYDVSNIQFLKRNLRYWLNNRKW